MRDSDIIPTWLALAIRSSPPSGTTIVHAISGRVRLRVPILKTAPGLAGSLDAMLMAQPGITGVNVNRRCYSVTITFDPLRWTPETLCAFLQPLRSEDIEVYEPLPDGRREKAARIHRQIFWIAAGCTCLIVAIILVALPIVPGGIPFLILSIGCFAEAIHYSHAPSKAAAQG